MNQYFGAKDDEGEMYDYDEGYENLFDFDDEDYSSLKDALDGYYDEEAYDGDYYDGEYYDGEYYDDDEEDYNEESYDGDYYDGEYDANYYDGDYYDEDYYGDEYYDDGDYYYGDDESYDEDLEEQIAALENYYDSLNMDQYQRAYNAKYMNLMNAYNQLLAESNLYSNNYYNRYLSNELGDRWPSWGGALKMAEKVA